MNSKAKGSYLSDICISLAVTLVTLAIMEVFLRVANFAELRETLTDRSLAYDYDAALGWMPIPNSTGTVQSFRTTHYKHNSLGLRDDEVNWGTKPTIVFLGDSFVWGLDSEAEERFSNILKKRIPDHNILAAGVSGFGTDQEYLLLRRLWPKVKPSVVVLIFCSQNDRLDNSSNQSYFYYYKPYFEPQADGSLVLMGEPVPKSHLLYYRDNWLVRHLWLGRLATDVYVRLRHPQIFVHDPTEKLIEKMRDFVEGNGAKFLVGIQHHDDALASYLETIQVPFVKLEGAPFYHEPNGWGPHWTPEGQKVVAERILGMLTENNVVRVGSSAEK